MNEEVSGLDDAGDPDDAVHGHAAAPAADPGLPLPIEAEEASARQQPDRDGVVEGPPRPLRARNSARAPSVVVDVTLAALRFRTAPAASRREDEGACDLGVLQPRCSRQDDRKALQHQRVEAGSIPGASTIRIWNQSLDRLKCASLRTRVRSGPAGRDACQHMAFARTYRCCRTDMPKRLTRSGRLVCGRRWSRRSRGRRGGGFGLLQATDRGDVSNPERISFGPCASRQR